jgi:hypothetical protein
MKIKMTISTLMISRFLKMLRPLYLCFLRDSKTKCVLYCAIYVKLFPFLQDTTVRYSASKHMARISARLPPFLAEQVLENVLQLFSMHASPEQDVESLPAVAEATWHGTCLACAEMARRGLIPTHRLPELLRWLKKVSITLEVVYNFSRCLRRYFSTYVKAPIRWGLAFVMQHHMFFGHWLVPKMNQD